LLTSNDILFDQWRSDRGDIAVGTYRSKYEGLHIVHQGERSSAVSSEGMRVREGRAADHG
jgi:hypothetical protein